MKSFKVCMFVLLFSPLAYGMGTGSVDNKKWWEDVEVAQKNNQIPALKTTVDKTLFAFQSPLHWAVLEGDADLVRALIKVVRIPVDCRDLGGATALHKVAWEFKADMIRVLLAEHADVNVQGYGHETALHTAVRRRGNNDEENELIKQALTVLIEEGHANVDAQDLLHKTPLHYAVDRKNAVAVAVLIAHKANLNAKDFYGRTPLDYARVKGLDEIARMLHEALLEQAMQEEANTLVDGTIQEVIDGMRADLIRAMQAKKAAAEAELKKQQELERARVEEGYVLADKQAQADEQMTEQCDDPSPLVAALEQTIPVVESKEAKPESHDFVSQSPAIHSQTDGQADSQAHEQVNETDQHAGYSMPLTISESHFDVPSDQTGQQHQEMKQMPAHDNSILRGFPLITIGSHVYSLFGRLLS